MVFLGIGEEAMSKLPDRPTIQPSVDKFGIDKDNGLWALVSGKLRSFVNPSGIHLSPSDFSDLHLPSILFNDEKGTQHEVSLNSKKELLIDDEAFIALPLLTSPNGTKYRVSVNDNGELITTKEV